MAWTAPKTWVASQVLTAAELNEQLRDNFNETLSALAVEEGQFFTVAAENQMTSYIPHMDRVATKESTASTSYVDLTTVGPDITLNTGSNAFVFFAARMSNNTNAAQSVMSFAVSGATTIAANDENSITMDGVNTNCEFGVGAARYVDINEGENTFTCKYRAGGAGTAAFQDRFIAVLSF